MVTVGVDPHKHVHVAVAVDAAGTQLGKPLTVKNGPHMVLGLLTWARSISADTPVTWAIEDGHGFARRLADGLLLAGQEVVWVPTRLMMAHRKLRAATGAKSDPVDAAATACAAIAAPELDRHCIDERVRELRLLVDRRSHLVKRRTMVINQLKAQLHLWLDHTPGDLLRAKTVASVRELVAPSSLRPLVRQTLHDMLTELAVLNERVRELDVTIKELVSPLAPPCWRSPGSATRPQPC